MRHPLVEEWETRLRRVFERIDERLEREYGRKLPLHPARAPHGTTSSRAQDGLFNVGASFTAGFGSQRGPGYAVEVRLVTLSRVPQYLRERIEEQVAEFLRDHPAVGWVNYPGLSDHPQHALLQRQMRGASGLLAFGVKGGVEGGIRFIESAQFMSHLVNIGDTRTLISHPASTTHRQLDADQQLAAGVKPDMVRISVGLEHIDDILWDIDQALAAARA